jgi:hypothetical protein
MTLAWRASGGRRPRVNLGCEFLHLRLRYHFIAKNGGQLIHDIKQRPCDQLSAVTHTAAVHAMRHWNLNRANRFSGLCSGHCIEHSALVSIVNCIDDKDHFLKLSPSFAIGSATRTLYPCGCPFPQRCPYSCPVEDTMWAARPLLHRRSCDDITTNPKRAMPCRCVWAQSRNLSPTSWDQLMPRSSRERSSKKCNKTFLGRFAKYGATSLVFLIFSFILLLTIGSF